MTAESEPRRNSLLRYRGAIKEARFVKDFAHEIGISMGGRPGPVLEELYTKADITAGELRLEHTGWVNEQLNHLTNYLGNSINTVDESFSEGLRVAVKQRYRMFKLHDPANLHQMQDDQYLTDLVVAYGVDFFGILRTASHLNIPPQRAVEIARLGYHHNPRTLIELTRDFPDIPTGYITYCLISTPGESRHVLQTAVDVLPALRENFDEFEESILLRTAITQREPVRHLQQVRELVQQLSIQFSEFGEGMLHVVADTYTTKAFDFLTSARAKLEQFQHKYPDVDHNVFVHALMHNSSNPDSYIQSYNARFTSLEALAPLLSVNLRKRLARNVASGNPAYVEQKLALIKELNNRYPDLSKYVIACIVIVASPTNPEAAILKYKEQEPALLEEYADIGNRAVMKALIMRPSNPRSFLDVVRVNFNQLSEDFPDINKWFLKMIARIYYKNPHAAVRKGMDILERIEGNYEFPEWMTKKIVFTFLNKAEQRLREVDEKVTDLSARFPQHKKWEIYEAIMRNFHNPGEYLSEGRTSESEEEDILE